MVQNIVNLGEREDRIINIVKAMHGLKTKSEAIALIAQTYEENHLEPHLRPEYVKKLQKIEKEGKYSKTFNSMEDFEKSMKNAKV